MLNDFELKGGWVIRFGRELRFYFDVLHGSLRVSSRSILFAGVGEAQELVRDVR